MRISDWSSDVCSSDLIAALLDKRAIAARYIRIRNNPLDFRHGEEALGLRQFPRLTVDDTVAHHLLGAAKITLRELVMHFGNVVVDRPILGHKNAEGSLRSKLVKH